MKIKPSLQKKELLPKDLRLTTCTDCKYGIFVPRDSYVWTSRGLVHSACDGK